MATELLDKAREHYHVYHLHIKETASGREQRTQDGWKQLMSDKLIMVEKHSEIAKIIPEIVAKVALAASSSVSTTQQAAIIL